MFTLHCCIFLMSLYRLQVWWYDLMTSNTHLVLDDMGGAEWNKWFNFWIFDRMLIGMVSLCLLSCVDRMLLQSWSMCKISWLVSLGSSFKYGGISYFMADTCPPLHDNNCFVSVSLVSASRMSTIHPWQLHIWV